MNLGLRYEWEGAYTERYNRLNRGYDFATANPLATATKANYAASPIPEVSASSFNPVGGLLFAGVGGVPRGLSDIDRNNIAPRFGAAYQLNAKTVLRGGYGIFYGAGTQTGEARNGFSVTSTYVASNDGGNTPANNLRNPFPQGLVPVTGASQGLLTLVGQGIKFTSASRRQPLAHQYSFGLQRQLPWAMLFDISYVGNQVRDMPVNRNLNGIPESFRAAAETTFLATGRNTLSDAVTNPFFGLISSGPLAARTVTRGQLRRPYPQFTGIQTQSEPIGRSRYDALQMKLTRRFANGFSVIGSYAFTKQIEQTRFLNDQDTKPVKELTEFDLPQRLVVASAYELRSLGCAPGARPVRGPVGPGRHRTWLRPNRRPVAGVSNPARLGRSRQLASGGDCDLRAISRAPTGLPVGHLRFGPRRRAQAVNLESVWRTVQAALPLLRDSTAASIVTIASYQAICPMRHCLPYAVAKGGLISLLHALAVALALKIQVNAVLPGQIESVRMRLDHRDHPKRRRRPRRPGA